MRKFGKKVMLITRLAMFCAGFMIGMPVMWRIMLGQGFNEQLRLIFGLGTGVVLGLALMLSARSVLSLGYALGGGVKKVFVSAKPTDIAAVITGAAIAVALTCLVDFLLGFVINGAAFRVVIDVTFALIAAVCFYLLSSRVLRALAEDRITDSAPEKEENRYCEGYILDVSALCCERIVPLCSQWLISAPIVLDSTVCELASRESGMAAYRALVEGGFVRTVSAGKNAGGVAAYAAKHSLRIISARSDFYGGEVSAPVLGLETLFTHDNSMPEAIDERAKNQ